MRRKKNNPLTLHQLIHSGKETLIAHHKADAHIDAELLALYVLGYTKLERILNANKQVEEEDIIRYKGYIDKRSHGIPLQYITNEQEFMGLSFYVDPSVLIPRQDTETLVEVLLERSKQTPFNQIIEIGVGSGCISISLAKFLGDVRITGIDISKEALVIAEKNAKTNQVQDRIKWVHGDTLTGYTGGKNVDLIVSNPPYISTHEYNALDPDVKEREPMLALEGGADGLDFYRKITSQSKEYLTQGGMLAYEIGYNQGEAVMALLEGNGFKQIEIIKDLAHKDRVVLGRLG